MDADGDFVISWSSAGQDGSGYGIYARRYSAAGVAQGIEFRINTYTTGQQRFSSIAMEENGDFVVVWSSNLQDGSNYGIYGRRYSAAGAALGAEFQVNAYITGNQRSSRVAMDADGDFVVTWTSPGQDGSNYGVYGRRYNAAGTAVSGEFLVNTYTTNTQPYSTVSMDADGDFVIAWSSYEQDGSNYGVYAQRYNAAGVAQGSEFRVNNWTTDTQRNMSTAMDADGDFIVTWTSNLQDGSSFGIYSQRFNRLGAAQETELLVNSWTTNSQISPSVAMDADGDFVIVWSSDLQDGSGYGVYAQRFSSPDALVTDVLALGDSVTANEQLVSAPASLTVVFSNSMATSGAGSVTDPTNWRLSRNGSDVSGEIQSVTFGLNSTTNRYEAIVTFTAALVPGDYVLTAKDTLIDTNGRQLDGDANGTDGGGFTRAFQMRVIGGAGQEHRVNTYTAASQRRYAKALDMNDAGNYVVTWSSDGQDGSGDGIYGQRYSASGVAQGAEFRVNTYTTGAQRSSAVAVDATGGFVISWTSFGQDGSSEGIYARRFSATGVAHGAEFKVNTYTTFRQQQSSIAMDADGDFVISWSSNGQDGSRYGIYAQRYNASGVAQGSEFRVSTYTTGEQQNSTVAMDADGDFVIVWSSYAQDGSNNGIYAQRYNAGGVIQGAEFRVNTYTTSSQDLPTVAMDADGDFVIAWESITQDGSYGGVYARRYSRAGEAKGPEFLINSYTTGSQRYPAIAMDADGDFVISWGGEGQDGGGSGIYAQRYNAAGESEGVELRVNSHTTNTQQFSTVAMDADGDFVISWDSNGQDGSGYGVYAQRFSAGETTIRDVLAVGNSVTLHEQLVSATQSLRVAFSSDMSTTGPGSVTNLLNWGLTRNGVNAIGSLHSVTYGFNSSTGQYEAIVDFIGALTPGDYLLTAKGTLRNINGFPLDGDSNGVNGGDFSRAFRVAIPGPARPEYRVNSYTTGSQITNSITPQSVAMDRSGNYVIAWTSDGQDGSGYGIYAQRYNAAGVAQGNEFRVNTVTTLSQERPAVAMDADGDFVVTWTSTGQDGAGTGVYAQRFNASGVPQGLEFRVNTYTTNQQRYSSVAMNASGDFVISWSSFGQDGSGYGVYAQRYNSAGATQGSEFRVNSYTSFDQWFSSVAMSAAGDFVVTWSSNDQDGSQDGVYARRYTSNGFAIGSEFLVNTYTTGNQRWANVAMESDGDFIVSWTSTAQDDSSYGIFAQRYNAAGIRQGTEFHVNVHTTGNQMISSVAIDADGDFVISWSSSSNQDGNGYGVYARRYNAAGVPQSSEIRINTYTTSHQRHATVAMDADGDFVVAWSSYLQDGASNGIYAQRFGTPDAVILNVQAMGDPVTTNEKLLLPQASLTVEFSNAMKTSGPGSVTDLANWGLARNGSDVSDVIQSVTFGLNLTTNQYEAIVTFTAALTTGDYILTAKDTLTDINGRELDGDTNGIDGGDFTRSFRVRQIAGVGGEFRVNTYTHDQQRTFDESPQSVAMDDAGNFVITWASVGQDGSGYGVFAQRYNAAGVAQGGEFQVNTYTTGIQFYSTVAMDADGDFVITWTSNGQDGSGQGIYARRYSSSGVPLNDGFRVNTYTTSNQNASTVAMNDNGDFVVTWASEGQDGSIWGIFAQRYNAAGAAVGTEFRVSTPAGYYARNPVVSMDANGDFVVTWSSFNQDGSVDGVYARRYSAAGTAQGNEFRVNTQTVSNQVWPTVSMGADGDFVITWTSEGQDGSGYGIYAQRYNAAGVAQGTEYAVNNFTSGHQRFSTVAMHADGDFVITWVSDGQDGSGYGTYAQRYNATGLPQGNAFRVNSYTSNHQRYSTVAMDASGDFIVVWSSYRQLNSGWEIYAQRFEAVASNASPVLALQNIVSSLPENTNTTDGIKLADIVVTDDGVGLNRLSLTGAHASFFEIVGNELRLKSGTVLDFEVLSSYGVNVVVDDELLGNGSDATSPLTLSITNIREPGEKAGSEFQVNTFTTNAQRTTLATQQSIAMDDEGNFVVTWTSEGQDGDVSGVYAQRYNAAGDELGDEFRVNSYTTSWQSSPAVAMDSDGDFVITWGSWQDGHGYGIYAQRFNSAGVPQGAEFHVSTETLNNQSYSAVAMDDDGDFVIVWGSHQQDGSGDGVYGQRYNAAGVAQGSEFLVNTFTLGNQHVPSVAMDADGDFVVSWSSSGQDGSGYGIYAQRFDSAGLAVENEFRVNSYTTGFQWYSRVAMSADGEFVITWSSNDQDGFWGGAFAQRYSASGVAQGSEFQVNSYTILSQGLSSIAMDTDGDFVISWESNQDGNGYGIYASRFSRTGGLIGTEFRVNTSTTGYQGIAGVAMDADGDFVIVWHSDSQDGSQGGVFGQRYISAAPTIAMNVVSPVDDPTADVSVTVTDTSGRGVARAGELIFIDVDTNGDGDFSDPGERGFASAVHANGSAVITLPQLADGTYRLRARSYDNAISATGSLTISTNAAPTAVSLINSVVTVDENSVAPVRVADVNVTDDGKGVNVLSLFGPDAAAFEIIGGQVFFKSTTSLNFEAKSLYQFGVRVDDATVGSSPDASSELLTILINDVNEAPTAVSLGNTVTSFDENIGTPVRVADISVTDDALGVNVLSLFGPDAGAFEIIGGQVFFRSTTSLNFEAKSSYQFGVHVDDATVGGSPDEGSALLTILINDVNETPQSVALSSTSVPENLAAGTVVGAFLTSDPDTSDTFTYSLVQGSGDTDNASFTIVAGTLTTQAMFNFETKPSYTVRVRSTDQDGLWTENSLVISVSNVNEIPTLTLKSLVGTMPENSNTLLAINVADLLITDDALGTNQLAVTGANASWFEIVGTKLRLRANVELDFETTPSLFVTVSINDPKLGTGIEGSQSYQLTLTNLREPGGRAGNEFRVNAVTTNSQRIDVFAQQSVAMDSDGNYVITWTSTNQDGSGDGVYARRYDRTGLAVGGEFRVNSHTLGHQRFSAVAMDADGDFVITWTTINQDGSGYGVYARRFDSSGVPVGNEFPVNSFTTGHQMNSTVAMDSDGDFVITWSSVNQDGGGYGIYAQRYDSAGVTVGDEFRVNGFTTGHQRYSTAAMDADGDFVVIWTSSGQDGNGYGVYAQRYNSLGSPQGGEVRVNNYTTSSQRYAAVAMDSDGDFVVTWSSNGQDRNGYGIYARRYDAVGVALGNEFLVNTYTSTSQRFSTVAMDADGDFVITWGNAVRDGSLYGVYAQRYNSFGLVQGGEFRVNTYRTSQQRYSAVAMNSVGDFVVAWTSSGQDGNGYGVYAQRYDVTAPVLEMELNSPTQDTSPEIVVTVAESAGGSGIAVDELVLIDVDLNNDGDYSDVGELGYSAGLLSANTATITLNSLAFGTYRIRARVYDRSDNEGSSSSMPLIVSATAEPMIVSLSNSNIAENLEAGVVVGLLSTIGSAEESTFTYELVDGFGSEDNVSFSVVDNELRTGVSFDFETRASYSIRIRSTDDNGFWSEVVVIISVTDVFEDVIAPVSIMGTLPAASTSLTIPVSVTGNDPGLVASGVMEYDLFYSTGGAFTKFATVQANAPSTVFTGTANTTYWFRSIARDHAGNVETKLTTDTYTRFGDIAPPATQVTSAIPNSNGLFTIQMTGNKPTGALMTTFSVYVSIDDRAPVLVGSAAATSLGSGNYTGTILFQGALDGLNHSYRFFSVGRDGAGNLETSPFVGDVQVDHTFALAGLTATAIDVHNGVEQRSYVRYLDVLFSTDTGLNDMLLAGRVRVERFSITATSVVPGTGTLVSGAALSRSGNRLRLDFGANGLGGLRQAGNGFYRILLDVDGNGSFADSADGMFEFHRLFGDANGDGIVDVADTDRVNSQINRTGANLDGDLDGNAIVNATDRLYSTQQRGMRLFESLLDWLDD